MLSKAVGGLPPIVVLLDCGFVDAPVADVGSCLAIWPAHFHACFIACIAHGGVLFSLLREATLLAVAFLHCTQLSVSSSVFLSSSESVSSCVT